jgi:hypothetical protein
LGFINSNVTFEKVRILKFQHTEFKFESFWFMPGKEKKPRAKSARARAVEKLRVQSKALNAELRKVKRDLRSFGVGKKKKKTVR